jgi:hypothetical protein
MEIDFEDEMLAYAMLQDHWRASPFEMSLERVIEKHRLRDADRLKRRNAPGQAEDSTIRTTKQRSLSARLKYPSERF